MTLFQSLPEEFVRGHLGRWGIWNRFSSTDECLSAWRACLGRIKASPITEAAAISGLDLEAYVSRHTLLPVMAVLSSTVRSPSTGRFDDVALRQRGATLPKGRAFLCPVCASEDFSERRYSYWRRSHQLPGVLWCPLHDEALHAAATLEPFDSLPHRLLQERATACQDNMRSDLQNEQVQRFMQVSIALLDRGDVAGIAPMRGVLNRRAAKQGLRSVRVYGAKPLLSDVALKKFPSTFLRNVFPDIGTKVPGAYFHPIDGAVAACYPGTLPAATVMALTLLYPTVLDAVNALESAATRPTCEYDSEYIDARVAA